MTEEKKEYLKIGEYIPADEENGTPEVISRDYYRQGRIFKDEEAYHSEDETYSCDLCGFRNGWDESDELHGELWGCEKCGRVFCSKCFTDRHGHKQYMDMMQGNDLILCPDCWEKVRKTHGKGE